MDAFIKGTVVLTLAAFISECLEFLINMTLAKELGEYGIGQFMSILPVVALIMIIASIELPIAISKFVAEKEKKYHLTLLKSATKLAVVMMILLLFILLILFSIFPLFSETHPFIRWLILFLIPIISLTSIARGYFMGIQQMGKIAVANLFRRITQLFLLVFIFQLFAFPIEVAIVVALCAFIGGELMVFLYLMSCYVLEIRHLKSLSNHIKMPPKEIFHQLMAISLPTTGMRIFHALSNTFEPFLIKYSLVFAGVSLNTATEHFGMIAGAAMPIGFFPAFIAHSFMTILIPTVANFYANKNQDKLVQLLKRVILFTVFYGTPVCFSFYFFAEPLTKLFVPSPEASYYLQLLWPYFLLHYFAIPLQAFLIGTGLVKDAFIHYIWSTVTSFFIMFLLGSNENFLMSGIIIGMNMGALLLTLLHYLSICKKIGVSLTLRKQEKMII